MPLIAHTINAPESLKRCYQTLLRSDSFDDNIQQTKLTDFSLFFCPKESFDPIPLELYHLELIRQWRALLINQEVDSTNKLNTNSNKIKLGFLTFMGTLYFACEGFDGMTALLGVFSLPATLLFGFGLLFSFLAVIIFYSFDLVEISKNLGISWRKTPELVDIYIDQFCEIKSLIHIIQRLNNGNKLADADKKICIQWLNQLEQQYAVIVGQSNILQKKLDRPIINTAQAIVTMLAGLIHFSGGFFAGQTVMTTVCHALALSTTPTFWPILLFSLFIGLGALSIYWYVEKPGIEKFVSRWVGIDKEKLEKLQKPGRIDDKIQDTKTLKTALSLFKQNAPDIDFRDRTVDEPSQELCIHK